MSDTGENNGKSPTDALLQIFTDSNIVIIIWFLAVYFVVYLLLNIIRGKDGAKSSIARWVDIVSLGCLLIYLVSTYFLKSESEKQFIVRNAYSDFVDYLNSPLSLISTAFFIFTLYIVIYILAIPMDPAGKPITITIIENVAWILFVLVLLTNSLLFLAGVSITRFMGSVQYNIQLRTIGGNAMANSISASNSVSNDVTSSNKSITDAISSFFKSYKVVNGTVIPISETGLGNVNGGSSKVSIEQDEVFNIGNNMYTYDDAQSVCASLGSRLATYDEIESTYNSGGEWCNYGWSEGQSAYFPTQKETWKRLQGSEKTRNACGRPGVNGGYIEDDKLRFGVNCFGKKPKPKDTDIKSMSAGINIPKTPEDILLEKKIQFWKDNGDKLFKINSYNNNKWSMY